MVKPVAKFSFMEQWKEYKLGDISNMKYGKLPPKQNNGSYPIWSGYRNVGFATTYNCRKGTIIVVARGVGGTGDVKISSEDCFLTNLSIAVELDNKICEPLYFYYKYKLSNLRYLDTGSAQSQITIDDLKRLSLKLPPLEEQKRITEILSSIDYKIELNRRINDNLEQQAQALFDHYFDSGSIYLEDSIMGCLTDIAVYLNGLAMQKFPATDIERSLPVLKIKELGQRKCDDCSDRCSDSIDADYIIDNEDIIFSWSGTLMVDVWCGGKCGLNQHLFKVTPLKNYPRWFVYYWTNRHLKKFKLIAKDKAVTMGHIRRGDLENAEVAIPTNLNMLEINARINPLFQSIIDRRLEITKLENIRDALLPKLMSGELTINEI